MTTSEITWRRTLCAAVAVAMLATFEAPSTASPPRGDVRTHPTVATEARAPDRSPSFAPGRFGRLRVGMTRRQAVATGLVRWRYEDPSCGYQLRFRPRYRRAFLSFSKRSDGGDGRVALVGAFRPGFETTRGVGVGSTRREVSAAYPRLRGPFENAYGQTVLDRRVGVRNLTFVLGGAGPRAVVQQVLVDGGRPTHIYDGEGPC